MRPFLVHSCFRQSLNEPKPAKCKCRKRVSQKDAEALIDAGLADRLLDWRNLIPCLECGQTIVSRCSRCGGTGRVKMLPCPKCAQEIYQRNPCTRCGGTGTCPTQTWNLVKRTVALKTPRVMTVEKANIERAYVDGKQEDIDRIEEWGVLARQVWGDLTTTYWPEIADEFAGLPVFSLIGFDQRTLGGQGKEKI